MRLDKIDHDVSQLIERIDRKQLDLQPNFQRGQVWSERKKQRLIDSILRNWYVPPIHVVASSRNNTDEILDGQQRLRAIHEFVYDKFPIDGNLEPTDLKISRWHGKYYSELQSKTKLEFDRFVIITYRLRDYKPSEPGELFFRLNQIVSLTSAEQRNALFGPARDQIKELSSLFESRAGKRLLGFTNSRLNFDDILSRLALCIELGGIRQKITANMLEDRYRSRKPFDEVTINIISNSIKRFTRAITASNVRLNFNKASTFSWLYFIADNKFPLEHPFVEDFATFLAAFETARNGNIGLADMDAAAKNLTVKLSNNAFRLIGIFTNRASSRITDVSSVILRDVCLNATLCLHGPATLREISRFQYKKQLLDLMPAALGYADNRLLESELEAQASQVHWGQFR